MASVQINIQIPSEKLNEILDPKNSHNYALIRRELCRDLFVGNEKIVELWNNVITEICVKCEVSGGKPGATQNSSKQVCEGAGGKPEATQNQKLLKATENRSYSNRNFFTKLTAVNLMKKYELDLNDIKNKYELDLNDMHFFTKLTAVNLMKKYESDLNYMKNKYELDLNDMKRKYELDKSNWYLFFNEMKNHYEESGKSREKKLRELNLKVGKVVDELIVCSSDWSKRCKNNDMLLMAAQDERDSAERQMKEVLADVDDVQSELVSMSRGKKYYYEEKRRLETKITELEEELEDELNTSVQMIDKLKKVQFDLNKVQFEKNVTDLHIDKSNDIKHEVNFQSLQ